VFTPSYVPGNELDLGHYGVRAITICDGAEIETWHRLANRWFSLKFPLDGNEPVRYTLNIASGHFSSVS